MKATSNNIVINYNGTTMVFEASDSQIVSVLAFLAKGKPVNSSTSKAEPKQTAASPKGEAKSESTASPKKSSTSRRLVAAKEAPSYTECKTYAEIKMAQDGKNVALKGYVPKTAFKVLVAKATALGGEWSKDNKVFVFKTKTNAKKFTAVTVVTAEERNEVMKNWH